MIQPCLVLMDQQDDNPPGRPPPAHGITVALPLIALPPVTPS